MPTHSLVAGLPYLFYHCNGLNDQKKPALAYGSWSDCSRCQKNVDASSAVCLLSPLGFAGQRIVGCMAAEWKEGKKTELVRTDSASEECLFVRTGRLGEG